MPVSRWGVELPLAGELPAPPRGVVVHWTGGGPRANSVDLGAYHYVVEFDGTVRQGRWSVAANMRSLTDRSYAMHTGGHNGYRVGLSAAGMKDYLSPTARGSHPLTGMQVRRMMEVAAYFLELGGLNPLDPAHLCSHREVWTLLGIKGAQNHLKKDIEFLPFLSELKPVEVGDYLRRLAAAAMSPPAPGLVVEPIAHREPEPTWPVATIVVPDPSPPHPEPRIPAAGDPWWRRVLAVIGR